MLASILVVVISWSVVRYAASAPPSVPRCSPAHHICEGKCPGIPRGVEMPDPNRRSGVCLQHPDSGACVCWMHSPADQQHLQTIFRCDALVNHTVMHKMCLPPPICFPPGLGCLIVPYCECAIYPGTSPVGRWRQVAASVHRSHEPVQTVTDSAPEKPTAVDDATPTAAPPGDSREFSLKHLLFLLAFVIAPLVCWCLLTFFHEGRCRRKTRSSAPQRAATAPCEEATEEPLQPSSLLLPQQPHPPHSPKFESPPPYREAADPSESCLLAADCGPPPSYEDAVRDQLQVSVHNAQEPDSD